MLRYYYPYVDEVVAKQNPTIAEIISAYFKCLKEPDVKDGTICKSCVIHSRLTAKLFEKGNRKVKFKMAWIRKDHKTGKVLFQAEADEVVELHMKHPATIMLFSIHNSRIVEEVNG